MGAVVKMPPAEPDTGLRTPPHSREAEESVLGALLNDSRAWGQVVEVIAEGDLYAHEHRLIFAAMASLVRDGIAFDVITVFDRLEQTAGSSENFGGLPYLNALVQCVPGASGAARYAEIVREKATLRRLIAAADNIATVAYRSNGRPAADVVAEGFESLRNLAAQTPGRRTLPLLGYDEMREQAQAVEWLVKGAIQSDAVGILFGASGTFKTYLAIDLALHVAHGLRWLGRRTKAGPVLYIAAEGGTGLYGRLEAWHRARRLRPPSPERLRVVPAALDLRAEAWRVVDAAQMAGITPALVVVDTLSQTFRGEENSAQDVAGYLGELGNRLRALWRCTVLVLHHSGHSQTERPRGSSAIQANSSFLLGAYRDEKEMLATLTCMHQKEGQGFDDAIFQLTPQTLGTDADGDTVSQLVARHLSSSDEVQEAMASEHKAGRGGHNRLILSLAHSGMKEGELRKAFYDDCDVEDPESRRKAYFRARKWAINKGMFELVQGLVILPTKGAA